MMKKILLMFLACIIFAGMGYAMDIPIQIGVNLFHNGANVDTAKVITVYFFQEDPLNSSVWLPKTITSASPETTYWGNYGGKSLFYASISLAPNSNVTINAPGNGNYTFYNVQSDIGNSAPPFNTDINLNTKPSVSSVQISPPTPNINSNLNGSGIYSDPESDAESGSTYKWYKNGAVIAGQTTKTLASGNFIAGDVIIFEYTPKDNQDFGNPVNSSPVTVINNKPTVSNVTISPVPAYRNSNLTGNGVYADVNGDPESGSTFKWYKNNVVIAGQTTKTLATGNFVKGDSIIFEYTPKDGIEFGNPVNSSPLIISNTAPSTTAPSLAPTTAYKNSTLTCTNGTWTDIDGDAAQYFYAWYVNGAKISATGTTLSGVFNKGNTVYCNVTPFDGTVNGTAMPSNTVTISNTAPSVSGVTIAPNPAYKNNTLTGSGTYSDLDSDPESGSTYKWYKNNVVIAGQTATTLAPANFNKGDSIIFEYTPRDGAAFGLPVNSSARVISNTAPSTTAPSLAPTTAYKNSTLTCTNGTWTDIDGDAAQFLYAWYVNGAKISATGTTLSGVFNKGNTVYCNVTPFDGTVNGTAMPSNTVTISNSLPSVSSVAISPIPAYKNSTLTGSGTYADLDGDPESGSTYKWYKNNVVIAGQTATTLAPANFNKGDSIIFEYTPRDGAAFGLPVNSSARVISNTAPSTTAPSLAPTTAYKNSTLTCTNGTWTDIDGDAAQYFYAWYVNGAKISATGTTLSGVFNKGNTVYCNVTPFDGTVNGTAMPSNTVTISNNAPVLNPISNVIVTETNPAVIAATASDIDGDALTFSSNDSRYANSNGTFTWTPGRFDAGVYIVNVTVSDGAASNSRLVTVTVNDRTVTQNIPLVAGWNMFSLPVQLNITNLTQVLSSISGKYDIVWTTNSGVWQSTKNFFSPLNTITSDKSYQIYMNTAGTLTVSGTDIKTTTMNCVTGWNLIGYPSLDIRNINATLAGKDYSIVWTTNAGVWQSTKNFFNPLVNFTAGNSYRIYANSPLSITITNS